MNQINRDLLFTHHFTNDMNFKSHNEQIKCFRVMDEEGNIVNKDGHEKLIPDAKLKKMYETMVTINEADQVFNSAQR